MPIWAQSAGLPVNVWTGKPPHSISASTNGSKRLILLLVQLHSAAGTTTHSSINLDSSLSKGTKRGESAPSSFVTNTWDFAAVTVDFPFSMEAL